jgi:DNA-binding LacI/PurR family transcriptional regulator
VPFGAKSRPLTFNRITVADQAATALRDAIHSGALADPLPGEHQLSRVLGISRPSVRAALAQLATAGLIVVQKGRRTRVARSSRTLRGRRSAPRVCIVCPLARKQMLAEHPVLLEMHAQLASRGVEWEEMFDAKLGGPHPESRLQALVAGREQACWILFAAPEPIHRWFAGAQVATIVLGSVAGGLKLPSIDLDHGAVGRHAAGAILRHGHSRVGMIGPAKPLPGDLACRRGFLATIREQVPAVAVTELGAPENPLEYRARLTRLLERTNRPTALFSMRPTLTLTLLTHVLASGLRIPADVSFVSRDTHELIESALPELTRYSSTATVLATRAVRLVTKLLSGHTLALEPNLVMPTFVAGHTLAKCDSVTDPRAVS